MTGGWLAHGADDDGEVRQRPDVQPEDRGRCARLGAEQREGGAEPRRQQHLRPTRARCIEESGRQAAEIVGSRTVMRMPPTLAMAPTVTQAVFLWAESTPEL